VLGFDFCEAGGAGFGLRDFAADIIGGAGVQRPDGGFVQDVVGAFVPAYHWGEQVPPGWKRRLYGRQDARHSKGRARGDDGLGLVHMFLANYGRVPGKIIRAHSALGLQGRGYWGLWGLKIGKRAKSGKLILGNPRKHWVETGSGGNGVGNFPKSGKKPMY